MNKRIKWFDLGRLGAALKVIPESPLRGVTISCLEITDSALFQKMRGISGDEQMSESDLQRFREQWQEDLKSLGFSIQGQRVQNAKTDKVTLRFYSLKTEFSLSELRRLVPVLQSEDYQEMSFRDIVLDKLPDKKLSAPWAEFAEKVLTQESLGVWTAKVNVYDRPFDEARLLSKVEDEFYESTGRFELFDKRGLLIGQYFLDRLASANYRENALVAYFVDKQSALQAGWIAEDLKQVDMPYALPLWVDGQGKIVALRDVRYAPEIMDVSPINCYGSVDTGIVVEAIRSLRTLQPVVLEQVQRWRAWAEQPDTLSDPNAFRDSLTQAIVPIRTLKENYPQTNLNVKSVMDAVSPLFTGGTLHVKEVAELNSADMNVVASNVSRILWDDESALPETLMSELNAVLQCAQARLEMQAKEDAQERLHRVAEHIQATPEQEKNKIKHVDTGEKIGGARKDYARRAMSVEDLDSMNDLEKKALVVKKNIWPSLDYEAMRDRGVTARAAIAIKVLKDALNTAPTRRRDYAGDIEADYIQAVGLIREAMADIQTLEEFAQVCHQLCERGREIKPGVKTDYISGGTPLQVQWGDDVARWLFSAHEEALVPPRINYVIRRKAKDDNDWSYLIKPKVQKNEAEVEADKEKSDNERLLHRPHLDKVERYGRDWRQERDIVAQDLIDHFGFRAVEFGNWLPQDERQQVLNMAFDSLCDLADALKIPPKGVSLGGNLAVAFGSRGRGGKNAFLAHFEPLRNVINLTRLNGAGALAHEWCHALDFYLGDKQGLLSELTESRKYVASVMSGLVKSLKNRNATSAELHERAWSKAQRGRDNALSWLYDQPNENREALKKLLEEQFQAVHASMYVYALEQLDRFKSNPKEVVFHSDGVIPRGLQITKATEIAQALKKACEIPAKFGRVQKKIDANLNWMMGHLSKVVTLEAAREKEICLPSEMFSGPDNQRETQFYLEAKKLDKGRTKLYWSTVCELFARAGAAYIYDELRKNEIRSDYLVYGSDEAAHLMHPMGNPNPTGIDRGRLAEHFAALIDDYRLQCSKDHEAEAGMEP